MEIDKKRMNWTGLITKLVITVLVIALSRLLHLDWGIQYGALLAGLFWCVFSFPPRSRSLLVTLYFVFAIGVTSAVRIQTFVATNEQASELISDPTLQDALSFVAGMVIGLVVVGLPLSAVVFVSSEYVLALHAVHGIGRWDAFQAMWSLIMGIHLPWLIVEEGQATESKPEGVLPEVGGPGMVVIRPGNAVVLEWGGEVTRIVGPGLVKTKRFERIRGVVDLRPQSTTIEAENVLTRDRVPLTVKYGVVYQIEPKSDTDERLENVLEGDGEALTEEIGEVYPVYAATVRKAVFNVTPSGWQPTVGVAAGALLRDTVATFDFDEIFELTEDAQERIIENRRGIHEIEQRVQDQLTQAALNWGVKIMAFDVEAIEMPAEAKERMLDWWGADWQRKIAVALAEGEKQVAITKGEAEAKALGLIEVARAEAQTRMILAITQGFSRMDPDEIPHLLALRFLEAMEKMASDPATKILLPTDVLDTISRLRQVPWPRLTSGHQPSSEKAGEVGPQPQGELNSG